MGKAIWRKGVYSKDKTGTDVKQEYIYVIEIDGTRFDSNPVDGLTSHDWTLILKSDTPKAQKIVAGDMVIYEKHKYVVQSTAKKKNRTAYNSFDTLLYLK